MNRIESSVLIQNLTLRAERKRRGWSQTRLARALGVAPRTVLRWEQGIALPRPTHRVQLETLFGKTAEELGLLWDTEENEADDSVQAILSPPVIPHYRSALAIFPPKPHSFSEEAALMISQQPRETLDELCNAGLLEYWGPGRYSLHQIIAHYARVTAKSQ